MKVAQNSLRKDC